ncbi:MAG: hypothetical protein WCQ50_22755, partial [Spirochaetota bacterium]
AVILRRYGLRSLAADYGEACHSHCLSSMQANPGFDRLRPGDTTAWITIPIRQLLGKGPAILAAAHSTIMPWENLAVVKVNLGMRPSSLES